MKFICIPLMALLTVCGLWSTVQAQVPICPAIYRPVCATQNGQCYKTFSNDCMARGVGFNNIAFQGACEDQSQAGTLCR